MSSNLFNESIFTNDQSQVIIDYDLNGGFDINGQVKRLYGVEALSNSINIWLKLKRGSMLRRPLTGGIVDPYLSKPLSEETAFDIQNALLTGFDTDYQPSVIISRLRVGVDFDKKQYNIELSVSSKDLKIQADLNYAIDVRE